MNNNHHIASQSVRSIASIVVFSVADIERVSEINTCKYTYLV
jgi:hypothetical protein